ARQGAPGRSGVADRDAPHPRRNRAPTRVRHRGRPRLRDVVRLPPDALRLRAAGDRGFPAHGPVRRHAVAQKDPRRDVHLGRDRGPRRRERGRRLRASDRPDRPPELLLRLHRDRGRRPGPVQPDRGRPRGVLHRRPAERGVLAPGRRLPVRPGRCDAGTDPLLRARRRPPRALPDPVRPGREAGADPREGCGMSGSLLLASGINDSFLVVILVSAVVYGTPLVYASIGELLAERSGVLNLGVEGMMLVGAVMGFWAVQRVHVTSAVSLAVALGVAAFAGAAMALIHAFLVITLPASQIVSGLALTSSAC